MQPVAAPAASRLGQEYRLPRSYYWLGLGCAASFALMGVVSAWAAWTNIDGSFRHPKETAVFFLVFWGAFTLLGLFLVRAYLVERLLVWEDRVKAIGSFRTREVMFTEVERVKWRLWGNPGGSVVLYGPGVRLVIWFANYGSVHSERLRDFFRAAIPVERQEAWERYDETFTPTPAKWERAKKARRWGYIILAVMGAGLLSVGLIDPFNDPATRWTNLIFGTLSVAFAGYVLFADRRTGPDAPAGTP
jgi:hypothetical protein